MFSITVTFKDFTVILLECSLLHLSPIVGYVDFKYCEITCCLLVLQCYYYYFFFKIYMFKLQMAWMYSMMDFYFILFYIIVLFNFNFLRPSILPLLARVIIAVFKSFVMHLKCTYLLTYLLSKCLKWMM